LFLEKENNISVLERWYKWGKLHGNGLASSQGFGCMVQRRLVRIHLQFQLSKLQQKGLDDSVTKSTWVVDFK
jgi:hypothetical protein